MRPPVEYRPEFLTSDEADELLEHYHGDWDGDLTRIYAEYSY